MHFLSTDNVVVCVALCDHIYLCMYIVWTYLDPFPGQSQFSVMGGRPPSPSWVGTSGCGGGRGGREWGAEAAGKG